MTDEFESVELEISEDDILYYLVDEDGEEIGFVIEQDGQEVECYYEGYDADDYEDGGTFAEVEIDDEDVAEGGEEPDDDEGGSLTPGEFAALAEELDGEFVEMEIDEDAIDHYLFDDAGNEVGFVIVEDGVEVECYYAEDDDDAIEGGPVSELEAALDAGLAATAAGVAIAQPAASTSAPKKKPAETYEPEKAEDHGYLYKMASIAGHTGNKARKKAEVQLDKVRSKAEVGVDKATEAVESGGQKLKEKADDMDLGITREGVAETTADLNAIAKEGAATAKELKEAYDDIMDSFGFLMPKSVRRKLP